MKTVRVLVLLSTTIALAACGGGDKKLELGGSCSLNSDCADGLLCKFGACHKACVKSVDCTTGERCVQVDGVAVCQMAKEATCGTGCPAPLMCRQADNSCRNKCTTSDDCLGGQACSGTFCLESKENAPGLDGGAGSDGPIADARLLDAPLTAPDAPLTAPDAPLTAPDASTTALDVRPAMDASLDLDGSSAACGELSQACCATGTACRLVTNTCSSGVCVECGQRDQACCGQLCSLATLECNANKVCSCGGANEKCCPGNLCNAAGLTCDSGGKCSCGGQGQLCCPGSPKTCSANEQCVGSRCTCIDAIETCQVQYGNVLYSSELLLGVSGRATVSRFPVMRDAQTPLENLVAVAASAGCGFYGLDSSGKVWQWGWSIAFQTGTPTVVANPLLVEDGGAQLDGVTAIAAGGVYDGLVATCFLKAGGVLCAGSGELLGYGFKGAQSFPVPVKVDASTPLGGVDRVSVGGDQACAIKSDGTLWCWGKSAPYAQQNTMFGTTKVKDVAANSGFACVLLEDTSVRCWGYGPSGELGDGLKTTSNTPVLVVTGTGAPLQAITALSRRTRTNNGGGQTCGLATDSSLWCWGTSWGAKASVRTTSDSIPILTTYWVGSTANAILPDGSLVMGAGDSAGYFTTAAATKCP